MPAFTPAHSAPPTASVHRYFHVVGASVWVTDIRHRDDWPAHFLGMLDDEACWGVDVPHGHDPADGAAVDLRYDAVRMGIDFEFVVYRGEMLHERDRTLDVAVPCVRGPKTCARVPPPGRRGAPRPSRA